MAFFMANKVVIFAALFAISEVLAAIPSVKANSIFDMVVGFLKMVAGK